MWTPEKVKEAYASLGFKPTNTKMEMNNLHTVLHDLEELKAVVEGELKKIHNRELAGWGITIATNKRIIFYRRSIIKTTTQEEITIDNITSTSFRKGILQSSICIYANNNEAIINTFDQRRAKVFVDIVQGMIIGKSKISNPIEGNHLEQLEKLFKLKELGAITEYEYTEQKNQLLGSV